MPIARAEFKVATFGIFVDRSDQLGSNRVSVLVFGALILGLTGGHIEC